MNFGSGGNTKSKAWRDIWGSGQGIGAISAYWGLWLLPLGALVYRSGFLPRILGVFLVVAEARQRTPREDFASCPGAGRLRFAKLDPALVLRAGPNLPQALEAVARALHPNAFR